MSRVSVGGLPVAPAPVQVEVGRCRTVTVNVAVAVLPASSVAEHVTVVTPIGNTLPEAGVHFTIGFVGLPSVALAVNSTVAPAGLVASTRDVGRHRDHRRPCIGGRCGVGGER